MPPRRLFVSHSAKEPEAGKVLTKLVPKLRALGFKVFYDSDRLETGQDWRSQIYHELYGAHGAVVLFSKHALLSQWVRNEVTALIARKFVYPAFELVTVRMPDVPASDWDDPGWKPLDIARFQGLKIADPGDEVQLDTDVDAIVEHFRPVANALSDAPADVVEQRIRRALPPHQEVLERALISGGGSVDVASPGETAERLAATLLREPPDKAYAALRSLQQDGFDLESLREVVDVILPFWIKPDAILPLAREAKQAAPPPHKALALQTDSNVMAKLYVQRAAAQHPLNWGLVPVTAAGGELLASAIVSEMRDHIRKKGNGRFLQSSDVKVDAEIARIAGKEAFVVLLPEGVKVGVIDELRALYPSCTFLRYGDDAASLPALSPEILVLEPLLTADEEAFCIDCQNLYSPS